MSYSGSTSATAVTVTGGNQGDHYQGGSGNETFVLGSGNDVFDFSHGGDLGTPDFRTHGTDKIVNFDLAEDTILFRWGGGDHQDGDVSIVEQNGHTILTSKIGDTVFQTLDVDAIGIQGSISYDWMGS
jgi:Ca2+-binding RTX toxin-like protein